MNKLWTSIVGAKVYLILGALLLAAVGGCYLYVKHLENRVSTLTRDNIVLKDDNEELGESLEDINRKQNVTTGITNHFDTERQQNRINRDKNNNNIQKQVNAGEDKPVGTLLRDFLNAE